MKFTECIAPFELGCETQQQFLAQRTFLVHCCVIPAVNAQAAAKTLNSSSSQFAVTQDLLHLKRIVKPPPTAVAEQTGGGAAATPASSSSDSQQKFVQILLCKKADGDDDDLANLKQSVSQEIKFDPVSFSVERVPAEPRTIAEWTFAQAMWHLSVPRPRIRASDPSLFSAAVASAVEAGFRRLLEEVERKKKNQTSNGDVLGAAIVAPGSPDLRLLSCVVSDAVSSRADDVASLLACPYTITAPVDGSSPTPPTFQHPTFEALRAASQQQAVVATNAAAAAAASSTAPTGYLCNDLILVATHEPCVMCSMGLVHSRISMAFFLKQNANRVHGGLGGVKFVNRIPTLNHRFPAYAVEL